MISGGIILWSGAIVDIPDGYVLCDGDNDTPDLRNKFVPGSGDTYAPDDSGGSDSQTHDFTGGGHTHTIPTTVDTPGTGPHERLTAAAGTTDAADNRPQYYSLAYIMKT